MRSIIPALLSLAIVTTVQAADPPPKPSGDAKIVDPDAKLEHLFTRSAPIAGGLTEGPAVAPDGSIYFSDPRYLGPEPRELEHRAVYRIDKDGTVTEVTHECEKPNGIALSPDRKTLYLVDHNNGTDTIDPTAPPPKKGAMKLYGFT